MSTLFFIVSILFVAVCAILSYTRGHSVGHNAGLEKGSIHTLKFLCDNKVINIDDAGIITPIQK